MPPAEAEANDYRQLASQTTTWWPDLNQRASTETGAVHFQFRDIRAKAATDTGDLAHSQKLLAHKNRDMTEHYVKARIGERVKPLR